MGKMPAIKSERLKALATFRELDVSQAAMCLAAEIYVLTHAARDRGLRIPIDGMRRAADALPPALARGQVVRSVREFGYHICTARVHVAELEGLLMLGEERGDFKPEQLRHIFSLMRYIKSYCSALYMAEPQQRSSQVAS
jgi:four helix bundle protein